jgi:Spy/CpxP family protein refolding chaperone
MKTTLKTQDRKQTLKRILAGAGLALALPLAAFAQGAPSMSGGPGMDGGPRFHMRGGPGEGGHGHWGHRGHHGGAMFLRGINLTDAQKDKIFAIRHALAPQMYEKFKLVRQSREDLRGMATAANYDEARAKAAIDAGARAKADIALLRLRGEHDIFSVLTPEQKAQVEKNRQNFLQHRMSMGERGGPRAPGGDRAPQK